jgi:hypothetical protein
MMDLGVPEVHGSLTPGLEAGSSASQDKAFARSMRRKMYTAILIAVISTGATVMSCAGQGISYRQMRAIDKIASERCK